MRESSTGQGLSGSLFWRLFLSHLGTALVAVTVLALLLGLLARPYVRGQRQRAIAATSRQTENTVEALWPDPAEQPPLIQVRTLEAPVLVMSRQVLLDMRAGKQVPPATMAMTAALAAGLVPAGPAGSAGFAGPPGPAGPPASSIQPEIAFLLPTLSDAEVQHLLHSGGGLTRYHERRSGNGWAVAVLAPMDDRPPVERFMVFLLEPTLFDELRRNARPLLAGAAGVVLLSSAAFALGAARTVGAPLREMGRVAGLAASGDLSQRVPAGYPGELGAVACVFNRALDEMARALDRQQRLDQERRDLVASVSHEFRAPVASLRGYLELIRDGVIRPEEQARYVRVMLDDTLRLSRLMEDLLDLARLQAGQVVLHPVPLSPGEACWRVADHLRWMADARQIRLDIDMEENLPDVLADPDRLDQMLTNLLENALRYAGAGQQVRLGAGWVGDGVRFFVHDTGPGIPLAEQARVWERFYKVDRARSRRAGGTGLGLAIVKELGEAMGGQVGLESEPGRGTTFWFTLPVARS